MSDRLSPTPVAQSEPQQVTFSRQGALTGAKRIIPIALGGAVDGLVFGVLAQQAGLSVLEVLLMSALVYAGSAQFIVLTLWVTPLPISTIIFTTLIVNARCLLMGVAISPWFLRLSRFKAYTSLFFLADENWALQIGEFDQGRNDAAFLLGSGLVLFVVWIITSVAGRLLGSFVQNPSQWGLDFIFTAVFLSLLVTMWKGKASILPWIAAALVAVAAAHWIPGKWYILLGGLAGSLVGMVQHAD